MPDKETATIESLIAKISSATDRDRALKGIEQILEDDAKGEPPDLLTFLEVLEALKRAQS